MIVYFFHGKDKDEHQVSGIIPQNNIIIDLNRFIEEVKDGLRRDHLDGFIDLNSLMITCISRL